MISTLDRLGCSIANMLELSDRLRTLGVSLRVSSLGGDAVDTAAPIGSMLFTVMAALAQTELDIKCGRINEYVSKRRAASLDLGRRREKFTRSQLEKARKLVDAGEPATHVASDLGTPRATLYRRLGQLGADGKTATPKSQRRGLTAVFVTSIVMYRDIGDVSASGHR